MTRETEIVMAIMGALEERGYSRHELYLRSCGKSIIKFSYGEFLILLGELRRLGDVYIEGDMYYRRGR